MILKESDLYPPVKEFLEGLGCTVRGEVAGCDIAALQGEELIAVELKRSITLRLLVQAVERQQACDAVYIAVPAEGGGYPPNFKANLKLVKRLGLGVLLVRFLKHRVRVELVCHPGGGSPRRSGKRRQVILREMAGRSGDHTPGGTRGKVVTAYREEALFLALLLSRHGTLSPARCREMGGSAKSSSILRENHYGWFDRIGHGLYRLHPAGSAALEEYAEVVAVIENGAPARPRKESGQADPDSSPIK